MSAVEPLHKMINLSSRALSQEKFLILEAQLLALICSELKKYFKSKQSSYFSLINHHEMESFMEANFVSLVIKDIIATGEYTGSGIACYTRIPEEVIEDIMIGRNTSPSVFLFEKIIELHRSVRKELYYEIMKKIINITV